MRPGGACRAREMLAANDLVDAVKVSLNGGIVLLA